MAVVTRFDTPASLRDLPPGSPFYDTWHTFLASRLNTTAGTGTATGEFYDPSEVDISVLAERSLVWMAFPRQVLVAHRDDPRAAFIEADGDPATRDPQNEYCEWHVTRNAAGRITTVTFVTESPEYCGARASDLAVSIYPVLVAQACNVPLPRLRPPRCPGVHREQDVDPAADPPR